MSNDNQILKSREVLMTFWLERVKRAKMAGVSHEEMHSPGVIITRTGTLRVPVNYRGSYIYDLEIRPEEPDTVYEISAEGGKVERVIS